MKRRIRSTVTAPLLLVTFFSVPLLLSPLTASGQETYLGEGKDQLVQALDGAIARVLDSGQWRTIMNSDPNVAPLVVNIGDCYPRIEDDGDIVYPFPQNPVGLLKDIIDNKRIWVGDYDVNDPFIPGTFHVFDNVNPALLRAIIDELGAGYGIPPCIDVAPADGVCENDALQIVKNNLWPPSSKVMFERLALGRDDSCDPLAGSSSSCGHDINGFNAALGATVAVGSPSVEKRRRDVARFTCTVFGTNWYAHVRNDSGYTDLESLIADTTANLCVGQLSSRLSNDYFKNAASITQLFTADDLVVCSDGVRDGTYDIYLHFDPVPVKLCSTSDTVCTSDTDCPGGETCESPLISIPLQIVSGIPIWVAGETSCEGLDVCKGDFNADQNVGSDDVARFLEDTGRNIYNNPCPKCVNGW